MKPASSLAAILTDYRKRRGLSQDELADAARLSLRTVQRLENGQSLPRGFTLQALAKVLDVPIDVLTTANEEGLKEPDQSVPATDSTSSYVALMYLSALSYLLIPGANILLPLLMRYRKRESAQIQEAGSRLLNFELMWTLVTFGGYFMLLAAQIVLLLYTDIVVIWAPTLFILTLYAIHVILLLTGAWRAKKGRYTGYPALLEVF